ncbi:MAG: transcriptional regulator [Rhodospirillaceae bacterium]|nr:transcriptional regulator [Rhodospirillaceae bacterium]
MTLFGKKLRELRKQKQVTMVSMAEALGVSAAYLSALETGKRGVPSVGLMRQIKAYFGLIWDDAEALEKLAQLSNTRVKLDTRGLSPKATEFANRLSQKIVELDDSQLDALLAELRDPLHYNAPQY